MGKKIILVPVVSACEGSLLARSSGGLVTGAVVAENKTCKGICGQGHPLPGVIPIERTCRTYMLPSPQTPKPPPQYRALVCGAHTRAYFLLGSATTVRNLQTLSFNTFHGIFVAKEVEIKTERVPTNNAKQAATI